MNSENPDKATSQRLFELMLRYLRGDHTREELSELEAALEADRELRDEFRRLAHSEEFLRSAAATDFTLPTRHRPRFRLLPFGLGLAAGIVATLATGFFLWPEPDDPPPFAIENIEPLIIDNEVDLPSGFPVAVLPISAGADFGDFTTYQDGEELYAGRFRAKDGLFVIDLRSGVSLLAKAPLDLELVDPLNAICHEGDLRVQVPPRAGDFKLATPDRETVGEGPLFGVSVREAATTLKLASRDTGDLDSGFLPRIEDVTQLRLDSAKHTAARWEEQVQQLLTDPSLQILYRFQPEDRFSRHLKNEVSGAPIETNGMVVGGRWTDGPIPGLAALEFKQISDSVLFSDDHEYSAITLIFWLRFDRFAQQYTSLVSSDGWEPQDLAWYVSHTGSLTLAERIDHRIFGVRTKQEVISKRKHFGQWIQLAVTCDTATGLVTHYIDGKPASSIHGLHAIAPIVFGSAELANWRPVESNDPSTDVRNFDGRMAFFAAFDRVLSREEIAATAEAAKPVEIQNIQ